MTIIISIVQGQGMVGAGAVKVTRPSSSCGHGAMHFCYYIGLWLLEYVSIRMYRVQQGGGGCKACKDSKDTSPPGCILGPVDRVPAPAQPSVGGNEESVIADC